MASDKQSPYADTQDTASGSSVNAAGSTRRTVLKGVAAAGLAAPLASRGAKATHQYEDRFDTIINMVDAGADPNGNDQINALLEEHAADDTLLYFPEGRYYMDRQFRFTGFDNFGIVGDGATIVPANYWDFDLDNPRLFRLGIYYSSGRDLLFEGFTIDQTADDTGVRVIEADIADGLEVRNIDIVGQHDSGLKGPARFAINDSDGSGVVEDFRAEDGGAWVQNTPNDGNIWRGPTGILCNAYNEGTMTFKNCALGGFPDNGLYATSDGGQVRVEGGYYANSQAANIRIGGPNSYVDGATVEIDRNRNSDTNQLGIRAESSEAIRIRNCALNLTSPNGDAIRSLDPEYIRVTKCDITVHGDGVNHGINIRSDTGEVLLDSLDIDFDTAGGAAIRIEDAGNDPEPTVIEESNIYGDAGHESNRAGIWSNRDNVEYRALDVEQTGSSMRRALVNDGDDALIYNSSFVGSDTAVYNIGNDAWIESVYAMTGNGGEGIRLVDGDNVLIKKCNIENGIELDGVDSYREWGNDFS